MKISDLMNTFIDFAEPEASARELAELMGDLDVGAVPIGTAEQPVGVVTDRDILFRVVARGLDPSIVTAREILSAPVHCCRPGDSLQDALDLMAVNQVRRLGVREGDGPLVGWLTLADVSRALLLESEVVTTALAGISGDSAA